jgi:hypothetical protein
LSQAAGKTIDLGAIQDALAATDFENGVGSKLPVSALGGSGALAYGAAKQAQQDTLFGPGQRIGDLFKRDPTGLTAETVLTGSTIFINPLLISSSLATNEGLLFHEALDKLGMIDETIQQTLGFKDYSDVSNTKRISTKLQSDCVTGKGNN